MNDDEDIAIVPVISTIAKNIALVLFVDQFYYSIVTYILLDYYLKCERSLPIFKI